jgi:hypothetical protein
MKLNGALSLLSEILPFVKLGFNAEIFDFFLPISLHPRRTSSHTHEAQARLLNSMILIGDQDGSSVLESDHQP